MQAVKGIPVGQWLKLGSAVAALAAAPVHGDPGRPFQSIEWREGRLSVDVDRVPMGELLTTVAGTTGVEVWGLANVDGTVSIHFANRSLRDGLSALLNRFNYAMIDEPATGDERERIVVIVVGPKSDADVETARAQPRASVPPVAAGDDPNAADAYQRVLRLADKRDVDALSDAAASGDSTTRALAMQHLARLDPDEARRAATRAALSEDAPDRALALQVLGGLGSSQAADVLHAALSDPEPTVRQAAVVAMVGQETAAASHFLRQALRDDAESVRLLAAELFRETSTAGAPTGKR